MPDTKRVITVNDYEHHLLIGCINKARNEFMAEGIPVDDVNRLLIKTIDAPTRRELRRSEREAR